MRDFKMFASMLVMTLFCALNLFAQDKLFWINSTANDPWQATIRSANSDGNGITTFTACGTAPRNVEIDNLNRKIYWSEDLVNDKIFRANLDGTGKETLFTHSSTDLITFIELDVAGNKMYFTNLNNIWSANLDGSNAQLIVSNNFSGSNLVAIELDAVNQKLYFAVNPYNGSSFIRRCTTNGSAIETLIDTPTDGLLDVCGLTLDVTGNKMYFSDYSSGNIRRSDLAGNNIVTIAPGLGYDVDQLHLNTKSNTLYFSTYIDKIRKINLTNNAISDISLNQNSIRDLHYYSVLTPEIDLRGNSISIADGDNTPDLTDHTDFSSVSTLSGSVVRTFTIHNTGEGLLNLTGTPRVAISGTNAADFTVTSQPVAAIMNLNSSQTFQVTFDPSAPGLRSAEISITNDDSNENPYNFAIQGTGLNSSPAISDITDKSVAEDSPITVNFTIGDPDTPLANLTVSGVSNNQNLIQDAQIVSGGSGADRFVTITPKSNANGSAQITITVNDGVTKATASKSFILTVTAANDAPVCTTDPAISGSSAIGATLTGTAGIWNDNLDNPANTVTIAYQWQRADDNQFTVNVADISGATSNSYNLILADQNKYLRLKVTGTDNGTPMPALSAIAYSNVLHITIPQLSGNYTVGTGGNYPNLSGAGGLFASLNSGIVTGNIVANVISDLVENGNNPLNQFTESGAGSYSLKIQAGDARSISGSAGSNSALIRLNGADRITIDGTKAKYLTFINSNATSGDAGAVISVDNGSDNCLITNCNISNSNPASTAVTGIFIGNAPNLKISKNKIYNFNGSSSAIITGIKYQGTATAMTATICNNMISLLPSTASAGTICGVDYSADALNSLDLYYNSVLIGSTQTGSANSYAFIKTTPAANLNVKNNIFYNDRTNSSGSGKHYAVALTNSSGTISQDYNLLYSAGNTVGLFGASEITTLANWISGTPFDDNSQSSAIQFENTSAGNLSFKRLAANSAVFNTGIAIAGFTEDFFEEVRPQYATEDIGAHELLNISGLEANLLPFETRLFNNYPNPFNPATLIKFDLRSSGYVSLTVFNARGELVENLVKGMQNAGQYSVTFDGTGLNSGVYFYQLEADGRSFIQKMLMIK